MEPGDLRTIPGIPGSFSPFPLDAVEKNVQTRFEAQVDRWPAATAVSFAGSSVSYAELDALSNRLANTIIAKYGTNAEPVALLLADRLNVIVAILAILKAGKFYVALNTTMPPRMLEQIIDDCGARFVLIDKDTETSVQQLLTELGNQRLQPLAIEESFTTSDARPAVPVTPDDLVLLSYTSGSTGEPKGVMKNHRHVLYGMRQFTNFFGYSPEDRVSMLASPSFGMARSDILGALLNGGTLCPYDVKNADFAELASWFDEQAITVLRSVPTLLRQFVSHLNKTKSSSLSSAFSKTRLVLLGGEPLYFEDTVRLKAHFPPSCVFVNHFGSTETGYASWHLVSDTQDGYAPGETLPIGYPVIGKHMFVVDEDGKEIPPAVKGEIVVRSKYLSSGYWQRPELTAAKFKPAADGSGEKLFYTGDLGSLTADAQIILHGRKGSFVKIRGFRIEPAHIETALRGHPAIDNVAITVRKDRRNEDFLACYIIPMPGVTINVSDLRRDLAQSLPDYMIPARFVIMDQFPTTHTGKIDKKELPDPAENRLDPSQGYQPPRSATEAKLAVIWADLLNLERIGVADNFFDLGGYSLLAAQMLAQINDQYHVDLPISTLIKHPTIEQLAICLEQQAQSVQDVPYLVPLKPLPASPGDKRPPLFLVHGAGSGVMDYVYLARQLHQEQPVYGLEGLGIHNEAEPGGSIEELAEHCVSVMRAVQPAGPYYFGGYCFGGVVAFEMARQLEAAGIEVGLLAIMDGRTPVNMQVRQPLLGRDRWSAVWHSVPVWLQDYSALGMKKIKQRLAAGHQHVSTINLKDDANPPSISAGSGKLQPEHLHYLADRHAVALRAYIPRSYSGRVNLFRAQIQSFSKTVWGSMDPTLGWGQVARSVEVSQVVGVHRNIHLPPAVPSLGGELQAALDRYIVKR